MSSHRRHRSIYHSTTVQFKKKKTTANGSCNKLQQPKQSQQQGDTKVISICFTGL